MTIKNQQWKQLAALTFAHAVADTYVGIIAPVLVPMQEHYKVSLSLLVIVASMMGFCSNVFQVPIGHVRATWKTPVFIAMGVMLAGTSVFIPNLPAMGNLSLICMVAIAAVAGFGVATVHPEGLRAVHGLDKLPPSLATAIFMVTGFCGFASGAYLSSSLTQHFGLNSIMWLYLAAPVSIIPLLLCKVKLHVDTRKADDKPETSDEIPSVPFVPIFIMATVLATCSFMQATLLPTFLHKEAGYELSFSGLSFTLFGVGGVVGAITWGALAPRIGHLKVLIIGTLLGAPLTALYLWLAPQSKWAAILLIFTAFIVYTGFPLCVTLARYAKSSLHFSQRIGLISGGTWGTAAVVIWILSPITEHTGFGPLLHLVWIGYLIACGIAIYILRKMKQQ
ncbi:MAG: MFS transporter [Kiritimatiellae bacterium]|jgi:FSR family fosmidomycin resistance protein-like MFS transporter|nr:MFS transporter [Kiritimatiellia bacterium]